MVLRLLASAPFITAVLGVLGSGVAGDEPRLTCDQIRLMSASGVIGPQHRYTVSAHCFREVTEIKKSPFGSSAKNLQRVSLDIIGTGSWERKSGRATEDLKFTGSSRGTRFASAVCSQDPWLKDPPGGPGSCHDINVQAIVDAGEIPEVLVSKVLVLVRSISLAEAESLSKKAGSAPPPPPPPAPTNPAASERDRRTGSIGAVGPAAANSGGAPIALEGEDLVSAGKAHVSSGRVDVQAMSAFGPGWSNKAQLLWGGAGVGATLDLTVDVAVPGTYKVQMSLTRAPDYATVSIEVDGKPASIDFVGWAPTVTPPFPFSVGTFPLLPGARQGRLRITGKRAASTGYLVGV